MPTVGNDEWRQELAEWLAEQWDPSLSLRAWRERLVASGWGRPSWPEQWYGRGWATSVEAAVAAELRRRDVVGLAPGAGAGLAGPTILERGSDVVKRRLLRPLLTGEHIWCQLFSEPGSGSDLASLSTRADPSGEGWVVNGQKVWNSGARHAHLGMLLARTNWDVPKHHGITYFALDMDQPGVDVRPLQQMNGYATFNEVFLDDVRVTRDDVVGEIDRGWGVALTTLAHERRPAPVAFPSRDGPGGRVVEEARAEADEVLGPYRWYPSRAGRPDLAPELAAELGRNADPVVRQGLADLHALVRSSAWTADRARAARAAGRPPGPEGSLAKLYASEVARRSARLHAQVAGAAGTLVGPDSLRDGTVAEIVQSVPAISIAGGTDEIQRNIVGERVLGLPKESQVDKDIPFSQVRRASRG